MTITPADVPRFSAAIRLAGELLEVHGDLMLRLTNDWAAGAKAANLDPDSGGNRWESCEDPTCRSCPHAIPSDPTGEAVIHARTNTAAELQHRLQRLHGDALWIRDMAHVLAPIVPPSTMNQVPDDPIWCSHHLKVGLCEPRHRGDRCRACYDFELMWKALPPFSLLRDRHHGIKWTDKTIKAALTADGLIVSEVGEVTRAVKAVRGSTGRPNQNQKRKAG